MWHCISGVPKVVEERRHIIMKKMRELNILDYDDSETEITEKMALKKLGKELL